MNHLLFAQTAEDELPAQTSDLWELVKTFVTTQGLDLAWNIIAALAIFVIGRWAAKLLRQILRGVLTRSKIDETLIMFLSNIAYGLLMTFVFISSIDRLGVDTTSFAAIVAAAGLAIGLSLQDSLGNFASGVMLILFQPFKVGDYINAGGTAGVVEEIHIFHTLMRTGDNIQIIVPNGDITSGTITNYSTKPTRRIDLVVGCGYNDDLKAVKEYLTNLISEDDRILADPEPVIAVHELADSCVNFVVRPWVNSGDYWDVRWDLTEKIKLGFDERGFNIPYPQQEVHMHSVAG